MVDLRQAISQHLFRFHIIWDSDRRCSYLFTNGIRCQYTSVISGERMLCHIPQRKDDCNYGSSLEQRNKTTDQCQTFRFYYRRLHLCQNTCIKVFAQSYFLLNLLINKQVFIAKLMSRNFLLCEEVAQCCFLLNGSFALPVSHQELFYILIIHIRQFLNTFVLLFAWLWRDSLWLVPLSDSATLQFSYSFHLQCPSVAW